MGVKQKTTFRTVAILGSGVMGAQIAALFCGSGFEVWLLDIAATTDSPTASIRNNLNKLAKMKPPPFYAAEHLKLIKLATFDDDLAILRECDLIIEAIVEDLAIKSSLYNRIAPHIREDAVLASNTSGLSLASLAAELPQELQAQFLGVHFFNPPRYLPLVELTKTKFTRQDLVDSLEGMLTSEVGKSVIHALDTPAFVANRVGLFSLVCAFHYAEVLGIGFDTVDALTGVKVGRARSATMRTADIVGLDTLNKILISTHAELADDPWQFVFEVPSWLTELVARGDFGAKTGRGIYHKQANGELTVLDNGKYRPVNKKIDANLAKVLAIADPQQRWQQLSKLNSVQAKFVQLQWLNLWHYISYHQAKISPSCREIDLAMRWGFAWEQGPFEVWQASGWQEVAKQLEKTITQKELLVDLPLPGWVAKVPGVHREHDSYAAGRGDFVARSKHPVYRRQLQPVCLVGESLPQQEIIAEDDFTKLWHQGDDILICSFKTKMHVIDYGCIKNIHHAIDLAEESYQGLLFWQEQPPFCAGANLYQVLMAQKLGRTDNKASLTSKVKKLAVENLTKLPRMGEVPGIETVISELQQLFMRLRTSMVPTVAAIDGLVLGGGCELMLHVDKVVATRDCFIGLVEAGVGLLPAAGGTKEMARRAAMWKDPVIADRLLGQFFEQIAMAKISISSQDAKKMRYLHRDVMLVPHPQGLLLAAKKQLESLVAGVYRPSLPRAMRVAGPSVYANFMSQVTNLRQGDFISEYDEYLASRIAFVITGGGLAAGEMVPEQWYLDLENQVFAELLNQEKTQSRIEYMLKKGKPLRN